MAWYRTGVITLTPGSDMVQGTGTAWVQNAVPGGILFTPAGIALEVRRPISDTQLQLAAAYAGAAQNGVPYAIAPTQAYIPELLVALQGVMDEFGDIRQAWADGSLEAALTAAQAALLAAHVYPTTTAGIAATTNGQYFSVRSSSAARYIDEFQNVNGVAVATGKSYPSAAGLEQQFLDMAHSFTVLATVVIGNNAFS